MSLRNSSAIGKTGFKFEDVDFHENAAIDTSKLGTRTLSVPLEVAGASFSGTSVASSSDGIFNVVLLPDANNGSIFWSFALPANYDSGQPTLDIFLKTTATGGTVYFTVDIASKATGESTTLNVTATGTASVPSTANQVFKITITFSGLTIAAGDIIGIQAQRQPANASDTVGADVYAIGAVFNYVGRG